MSKLQTLLASNRERARAAKTTAVQASGNEATVYLYEPIVSTEAEAEWYGGVSAQSLVPQIRALNVGNISLRINCPGGDVFAGQAIAQALRDSSAKVTAYIDGYAASAATVVSTAADEVQIAEGGMYMIHKGWTCAIGNADEMRSTAELLDKVDASICGQYARKTGIDAEKCMAMMKDETWFTAQEAIDQGFVDGFAQGAKAKAKAEWDLSAYKNAPTPPADQIDNSATDEHRDRQRQRLSMLSRLQVS
jgi:ATP-dependent protease ClpP protease subunit